MLYVGQKYKNEEESSELKDHPQESLTQLDSGYKVGRTWKIA
jgi:hypothetical protein